MKKVLFASRHPMTGAQLADAKRIWGEDVVIETSSPVFTDLQSVIDCTIDYDAVIAVLPQWLAFKVSANARTSQEDSGFCEATKACTKIWCSESRPVQAAHGTERAFEHVAFHRAGDL